MEMIEYTTAGQGRRLGLFVHHTDAEREFATTARVTSAHWTRRLIKRKPRAGSLLT